ncbi:MAG: methionine--tRNA ligase [Simkaniaceae bacterium]
MTSKKTKKRLITAALPYANGPLHFGHIAGCYLPADAYARFRRLQGDDVLYICGSDEYGVAITLSAEKAKRSPKEHVDLFHQINRDFFDKLNISFDHYSRTTWEGHQETVQEFFQSLVKNGHIQERISEQLYSEEEKRFLADRYVLGTCPKCGFDEARGDECPSCGGNFEAEDLKSPRSQMTGSSLTLKKTKHWYLRFDHFREKLRTFVESKNWKGNVTNFVSHYIDELRMRAITRDSTWGVPLPLTGTEDKVFYVWFDAPIGYISATKEWSIINNRPDLWKEYWFDQETEFVNFVGKDNIPFHAIFFPAMIMGQDQPYKLVDELPANEFYNLEGKQFSKSKGWTIDLNEFFSHFTTDQIRYVIASNAPETQDSEFTWKDFQLRCNSELLGKFGNLINRVLTFIQAKCEGKIPQHQDLSDEDQAFLKRVDELVQEAAFAFEKFHLRKASQLMMEIAQTGNAYFDAKKPWVSAKSEEKRPCMQNTLYCCLYALKALAHVSYPIIPTSACKIWAMLGEDSLISTWSEVKTPLVVGKKLPVPEILFQKVEDEWITEQEARLKGSYAPLKESIQFDDFSKLDLRVGRIIRAEKIPKSQKLLKLRVDLGFEERTIVSAIAKDFPDLQELISKKVVIVANLKPTKLMGVKSEGMLLVSSLKEGLELPQFQLAEPGHVIS